MADRRVMHMSSTLKSFGAATCVATLVSCLAWAQPIAEISEHLRPASAFSGIGDRAARSRALFAEAAKVITSPRCVNCHPAGDHPTQGNDEHVHQPAATRGEAGVGIPGLVCAACHTDKNFPVVGATSYESIPGHPRWGLAPIEMAWQGKASAGTCGFPASGFPTGPRACGQGRLGGLGMASRCRPPTGAGNSGRIWCDHSGVDRKWGGMPVTGRTVAYAG
jgi:hypothetical protein